MYSRPTAWLIAGVLSLIGATIGLAGVSLTQTSLIQAKQVPTQQVPVNQTATAIVRATEAVETQPSAPPPTPVSAESTTNPPELRGFSEALLQQLQLPEGFSISVYAQAKGNLRMLAFGPDGTLYVTRREQADLLALKDTDGDGRADSERVVASKLPYLNGVTVYQGRIYLATDKKVLRANLNADGSLGKLQTLIDDLPDAGQHPNRTLAVGPDNKLYITVGSTCNACNETNKENATILIANLDGSGRHIFAKGLRNTIGFDWHPGNGLLWGFDHGSDSRGDDQPPEELNLLQAGGDYGWPFCFGNRQVDIYNQMDPPGTTKEAYCPTTEAPILTYQAHSAPLALAFYNHDQFPAEYRGDAFVTMRGSWNRSEPTGYKVVRVRFDNGWPVAFEDFVSGFLLEDGAAQFGRLSGLTIAADGSLYFADDANGMVYRVTSNNR